MGGRAGTDKVKSVGLCDMNGPALECKLTVVYLLQ